MDDVHERRSPATAEAAARLPYVDEHAIDIAAGTEEAWSALTETVERAFSRPAAARLARILGCTDATASGPRPLGEGSTVPGFRVVAAVRERELALGGRHRFSSYTLTFRLDPLGPDHSRLRAETRAAFPGLHGRAYRLLIIGTGKHVGAVRSLLSTVRRRAKRP